MLAFWNELKKDKPRFIVSLLLVFYVVWQTVFSLYYYDYVQIFKSLPALLLMVYLVFHPEKPSLRFLLWFSLLLQILIWCLFFLESQTADYYQFHTLNLLAVPAFAVSEILKYFPRISLYIFWLVLYVVKPKNPAFTKISVLFAGGAVAILLIVLRGMEMISIITYDFNLFYVFFDFLCPWVAEFGYWFSFSLLLPRAIDNCRN